MHRDLFVSGMKALVLEWVEAIETAPYEDERLELQVLINKVRAFLFSEFGEVA